MTYLAYYFDRGSKEIVLAQDTLYVSPVDESYALLMDKVYHHEQSNSLVGFAGSGIMWGISTMLERETYKSYNHMVDGVVKAAVSLIKQLEASESKKTPAIKGDKTINEIMVFGFDKFNKPKASIIVFDLKNNGYVPEIINHDHVFKNSGQMANLPDISNIKFKNIPQETIDSHSKTLDDIDYHARSMELLKTEEVVTSILMSSALISHVASCHAPVSAGEGASIGGELVEYRINAKQEYKSRFLLVFSDNDFHNIPFSAPHLNLNEVAKIHDENNLPLKVQELLKSFGLAAEDETSENQ